MSNFQQDPNEWLSVKDLMRELDISQATAYRLTRNLPVKRFGRSIRIRRKDLNYYLINNDKIPTSR